MTLTQDTPDVSFERRRYSTMGMLYQSHRLEETLFAEGATSLSSLKISLLYTNLRGTLYTNLRWTYDGFQYQKIPESRLRGQHKLKY